MSTKDEMDEELKDAMRTHDRNRTEVARAVTAPGFEGEAEDELYRRIISAYTKKMGKALAEYESYGDRGAQSAAKLRFEVEYLGRWLPKAASAEEVAAFVDTAVQELSATDMTAMGQLMGHVMKQHPGLDGSLVSRLVRARLSAS